MDVLGAILMLLVAFGFFVGVISLIVLVVMAISKKNLKVPGIVTGSAFGVSLLAFIGFIILAVVDPVENTTAENEMPRSSAEANNEKPTKPKTSATAGNESEKDDEETEDEYDKNLAKIRAEREEDNQDKPDYQHEVIDNVDVYTDYSEMFLTPNVYMSNFSVDMTELLKEKHDEIKNGVIFRNAATVADQYGNEENIVLVSVWYSQETVDKINYENWPQLVGEDLYNTADGVLVHHNLEQDTVNNKSAGDDQPDAHRYGVGNEYIE